MSIFSTRSGEKRAVQHVARLVGAGMHHIRDDIGASPFPKPQGESEEGGGGSEGEGGHGSVHQQQVHRGSQIHLLHGQFSNKC